MLQKLKDSIQVLGMGARYMGHTLYLATHAAMLAIARAFAFLLLHWAKVAFLAMGIVIGHFGPGLYDQYAPVGSRSRSDQKSRLGGNASCLIRRGGCWQRPERDFTQGRHANNASTFYQCQRVQMVCPSSDSQPIASRIQA
jgi:hypothetical protein